MNPVVLHYSEALVRAAVKAFWFRVLGWRFVVAVVLLSASLVTLVARGERSWFVGMLGTGLAVAVVFAVALYFVHYQESLARFRRMRTPEAALELSEQSFRVASDAGSMEVSWNAVPELWRFSEFWLLFLSRAQFITLPTGDLDLGAREFIVSKVLASGAKVA